MAKLEHIIINFYAEFQKKYYGSLILSSAIITQLSLMEVNLVLHMYTGQGSRLVGAVVGGHSLDDFIATKESRRFPEMPALPPLVRVCLTQ